MAQGAKRDYYEILGVPRDADDSTIKKAFRQLAREMHPDVSADPAAEEKFRDVAEAYEVLSDAERRSLYDRFGHEGLRSGGFRPTDFDFGSLSDLLGAFFGDDFFAGMGGQSRRARRGADVAAEISIELAEAAQGASRQITLDVAGVCGRCAGNGAEPGSELTTCSQCGGAGRVQHVSRTLFGQFVTATACDRCNGSGRIVAHPCEECRGAGRVRQARTLDVRVPPGIHDGQRIRLTGEGHAGDVPGARAGDAYVLVTVRPDPRFVREGDDIVSTLELTMIEAALGVSKLVPTLEGDVELELKAGTQPGEIRVLRGKGMPVLQGRGRGDHRVLIDVLVPRKLTDAQRRLLEDFERQTSPDAYAGDEGFFDRVRAAFR
jgi:molecular chaperone DnaJ